ncbi:helix-turn-helix domain-containing protein [Kitasatospora sp. NPDC093806]|uniref:PucR family transcriptional regulator n=1 Tax=Kitasatospora sp. NPDC093806 TaxID=3155075 RepID=UPI0034300CAD
MDKNDEVGSPGQRGRLLGRLPLERVAAEAAVAVVRGVPAYRERNEDAVRAELAALLGPAIEALRERREPAPGELTAFEEFGALRAEQGIGLEPLQEAFRLTTRRAFDALYAAARDDTPPEVTLELTRDFWAYCDLVSTAVVRGHRTHELERVQAEQEHRTLLLRQLLMGELPTEWLPTAASTLGLDQNREYLVLYARPADGRPVAELERALRGHAVVLLAEPGADRVVGLAARRPLPSLELPVGVGSARPLARLHESLVEARRAARLATAFGLRRCVADGELPLHGAVLALPETGVRLVERCFGHTSGARRSTLARTLDAYLRADGNAEQAGAELFVHPNTLRYRLRAFGTATGLDLARTEDALTAWWALRHLEATGQQG